MTKSLLSVTYTGKENVIFLSPPTRWQQNDIWPTATQKLAPVHQISLFVHYRLASIVQGIVTSTHAGIAERRDSYIQVPLYLHTLISIFAERSLIEVLKQHDNAST